MELQVMLYQRLMGSAALAPLLATYDTKPAIFYQRPATADDPKWAEYQYPRVDYNVDLQENPARNTSGLLSINVWCDTEYGAEPEDIEQEIRGLLHATFVQAEDYPYAFSWTRSDAFEVKAEKEQTARTIGVSLIFDIMAFPLQYTMMPDPIKAMNDWTKRVLPDAVVIGVDAIDGWLVPTSTQPVIYWRLSAQGIQQRHFTHTWVTVSLEGHVFSRSAQERLIHIAKINTAAALAGHIPMEDGSPLFLTDYQSRAHFNYLSQGQIQTNGRFGVLQPWYYTQPEPKLNRVDIKDTPPDGPIPTVTITKP